MKIAILTDESRAAVLKEMIHSFRMLDRTPSCIHFNSYDDFIAGLSERSYHMTIVAQNGAGGMESVRAAKILLPEVPLIWLSDDKAFGPESYRVGCAFFSAAPITPELLRSAFSRCNIQVEAYTQ